jgi:D-3-phosphoglycerate dehydrogenase / 2-oxoglutarate reductase
MTERSSILQLLQGRPNILVTADFTADGIEALKRLGQVVLAGRADGRWFASRDEMLKAARAAEILVAGYEPIDAELLSAATCLKLIASVRGAPGANVDIDAATERGIPVLHTTGRTDNAVAEFTLAVILVMARNLLPAIDWMRNRPQDFDAGEPFFRGTVWGVGDASPQLRFTGIELSGSTLGLVGLGAIGQLVARKAAALGMRVLAADPNIEAAVAAAAGAELVELDQLLQRSDVISLHARLSAATRGMIGASQLRQINRRAYLVNTGRAGLVDTAALLEALDSGRLAGAAVDVFDHEPPAAGDPLVRHPRIVPTPHLAAWTDRLTANHTGDIVRSLQALAEGRIPDNICNAEVFEGSA